MSETVLMKGNEAIAEAAILAGCRHYFGYPITPQTEVAAYMAKKMPKIGGTFLQAESEIAAIKRESLTSRARICPPSSSMSSAAAPVSAASSPPSPTTSWPPAAPATAISTCWSLPPPLCRKWRT